MFLLAVALVGWGVLQSAPAAASSAPQDSGARNTRTAHPSRTPTYAPGQGRKALADVPPTPTLTPTDIGAPATETAQPAQAVTEIATDTPTDAPTETPVPTDIPPTETLIPTEVSPTGAVPTDAAPTATETPVPTEVSPTDGAPTLTETPVPTDVPPTDVVPTFTETLAPTDAPTPTGTPVVTDVPTTTEAAPTLTGTPVESETPTLTETAGATESPTLTETAVGTVSTTPTASATQATPTWTATPVPLLAVALTLDPHKAFVLPGEVTTYTVTITNTNAVSTTVRLSTNDSDTTHFTSQLQVTKLELGADDVVSTVLTVAMSADAPETAKNVTQVNAAVEGVEPAQAAVTTRASSARFARVLDGLGVSPNVVAPNTEVQIQVGVRVTEPFSATVLSDTLPRAWQVTDAGDASLSAANDSTQTLEWKLPTLHAGEIVTKTYTVTSPAADATETTYAFQTALQESTHNFVSAVWPVELKHPLAVEHYRIGKDKPLSDMVYHAPADVPAGALARFRAFRVRFQVLNAQPAPVQWMPQLEWGESADGAFYPVVVGDPQAGEPFYVRQVDDVADAASIPTDNFGTGWDNDHTPQAGLAFTAQNPAFPVTLNATSFTEVEYSVRATIDAQYEKTYYFRLSDGGRVPEGTRAAIVMETRPELQLSEPQYPGIKPIPPKVGRSNFANLKADPHSAQGLVDKDCSACHRSHSGYNSSLLSQPPTQANTCFTCHDGVQVSSDIKGQYADANVPADNAASSAFYTHPAMTASSHTLATTDEFQGVLNRHSECADCHNAHEGSNARSAPTANGYTVSGALQNISGVGVSGASRTLTWKSSITYEYELCYKCHSSYTVLPGYSLPSQKITDTVTEFNPANPSFHPIESAGANSTITMTNNLAGSSPYKLWNFQTTDVVRCLNCHGDYRLSNPASPHPANALLAPHTSENRGMLMNNYRDRSLKPRGEAYAAGDFALCYECHSEAPYVDTSGSPRPDTDFSMHGFHLNSIDFFGPGGLDIDTSGAGQGNALCAECHFRTHGQDTTANGNASGMRLLNFAPDVLPNRSGVLNWDPVARTCSLKCHGVNHNAEPY